MTQLSTADVVSKQLDDETQLWQEFESWEAASDEDFEKLELAEDDYLEGPPAP